MKELLWKEWREKRLIALFCPVFLATCFAGTALGAPWPWRVRDFEGIIPATALGCFLTGLLAGCDGFSTEIGSGSLQFLTGLPISRRRIWTAKVLVGAAVIAVAMALTFAVFAAIALAVTHGGADVWWSAIDKGRWFATFATTVGAFAVAVMVSPLVDRPLPSALIAFATCIGISILWSVAISTQPAWYWHTSPDGKHGYAMPFGLLLALMAAVAAAFLAASYGAFVHGDTLRTRKRFFIAGGILAAWAAALIVIIQVTSQFFWS